MLGPKPRAGVYGAIDAGSGATVVETSSGHCNQRQARPRNSWGERLNSDVAAQDKALAAAVAMPSNGSTPLPLKPVRHQQLLPARFI
jgi:hypothetical protein